MFSPSIETDVDSSASHTSIMGSLYGKWHSTALKPAVCAARMASANVCSCQRNPRLAENVGISPTPRCTASLSPVPARCSECLVRANASGRQV